MRSSPDLSLENIIRKVIEPRAPHSSAPQHTSSDRFELLFVLRSGKVGDSFSFSHKSALFLHSPLSSSCGAHMEILHVTNYDVLADKMPGRRYVMEDYQKHIGNTRFAVLVDMYREAYTALFMRGNDSECDKIVERIVGVACHKDVAITMNKGRFLIREFGQGAWVCLDEDESKEVARQALSAPDTPLEGIDENGHGEFITSTVFSAMHLSSEVPSIGTSTFDNDKKRGRRRSLLRRSASESTMMDDKKKLHIRGLGLDTLAGISFDDGGEFIDDDLIDFSPFSAALMPRPLAPSFIVSQPHHTAEEAPLSSEKILRWEGMDVVLSSSGTKLSSKENIIGNNRLNVMLSLQQETYRKALPEDKDTIAQGLVKAVCTYWSGRILLDQGSAYAELSGLQAVTAMKNLLDPGSAQPIRVSKASSNVSQRALLGDACPLPEFPDEAAIEILTNSTPSNPKIMQNQAIKSLQERKAKRLVAKSLGRGLVRDDSDQSSTEEFSRPVYTIN